MNDMTQQLQPIAPGQKWAMPRDGPWGGFYAPVTVLDVRDGWVRYSHSGDDDSRRTEESFRNFFQPYQESSTGESRA